jgi:hypothetical protein
MSMALECFISGDACSGAMVSLDGSGWLGMAKLGKGSPEGTGLLGIEEEGAEFGLGGA